MSVADVGTERVLSDAVSIIAIKILSVIKGGTLVSSKRAGASWVRSYLISEIATKLLGLGTVIASCMATLSTGC